MSEIKRGEAILAKLEAEAHDPERLADELERYAQVREALTGPDVPYLKSTVADALLRAARVIRGLVDATTDFLDWYDGYATADDPLSQAEAVAALRRAVEVRINP